MNFDKLNTAVQITPKLRSRTLAPQKLTCSLLVTAHPFPK